MACLVRRGVLVVSTGVPSGPCEGSACIARGRAQANLSLRCWAALPDAYKSPAWVTWLQGLGYVASEHERSFDHETAGRAGYARGFDQTPYNRSNVP